MAVNEDRRIYFMKQLYGGKSSNEILEERLAEEKWKCEEAEKKVREVLVERQEKVEAMVGSFLERIEANVVLEPERERLKDLEPAAEGMQEVQSDLQTKVEALREDEEEKGEKKHSLKNALKKVAAAARQRPPRDDYVGSALIERSCQKREDYALKGENPLSTRDAEEAMRRLTEAMPSKPSMKLSEAQMQFLRERAKQERRADLRQMASQELEDERKFLARLEACAAALQKDETPL